MVVIVLSSPATLTVLNEKKTGPSRFMRYFSGGWIDANYANRRELKPASCRTPLFRSPNGWFSGGSDEVFMKTGGERGIRTPDTAFGRIPV